MFKIRTGSHLYGLSTPKSDEDFMSVFIPGPDELLGLKEVEIIDNSTKTSSAQRRNTSEDVDDKSYSLRKYMHLLLQNNPNIVETLFVDEKNIIEDSEEYKTLRENYEKIVSLQIYKTFTGYAFSQKQKLADKATRYTQIKNAKNVLDDIVAKDPKKMNSILDKKEAKLLSSLIPAYGDKEHKERKEDSFHEGMLFQISYRLITNEYESYGWRMQTDTFAQLGYDTKFAYHLIRIMQEAVDLLKNSKLEYPISNSVDLMKIKNGELNLEEVLDLYKGLETAAIYEKTQTKLRVSPDRAWANKFVIDTHVKYLNFIK
jgi:hypothetical protein